MSNALPLWARCQPSILACSASRTASNSRFFGPNVLMMAATPAQNASGVIPVLGVASLATKSNSSGAIFNPLISTRFMMGFLNRNGGYPLFLEEKKQKKRQKGPRWQPLFRQNHGDEKGPISLRNCPDIFGEVAPLVVQDARL